MPLAKLRFYTYYVLEHLFGPLFQRWFRAGYNRWYDRQGRKYRSAKPESPEPLAEMREFDPGYFQENYVRTGRPVVLRSFAANWPCIKKWNLDFFSRNYGSTESIINNNRGLVRKDEEGNFEKLLLRDYISGLKKGDRRYLRFSPIIFEQQELLQDINIPGLEQMRGQRDNGADLQLFIGGKGTYTPLHCAFPANLFVQIMGRKKWQLYLPENNFFLRPPASRSFYFFTGADPYTNDDNTYPLFHRARGFTVTLGPGDVLYNPPYVWHCVKNETHTIGMGYRFNSFAAALKSSVFMTMMTLLSSKPNLISHMIYVRKNPGKAQLLFSDEDKAASAAKAG